MPAERLKLRPPSEGHEILIAEGGLKVPDDPILPIIEGDGIGPDVTKAARRAISAAVEHTFGGRRRIVWYDVPAGERDLFKYGQLQPQATFDAIREYVVAIQGPLAAPVGGGFRSLNVALRQGLDLYANVRPVYYIPGVPSPVKHPERMNNVIFREATEDVYAGIEWEKGSDDAGKLRKFLDAEFRVKIPEDAGIGLKPISERKTKRHVPKAIPDAVEDGRPSGTLSPKGGNIGAGHGVLEPIHGTAPKYAGMDKANPTAEILAGVMMLEYLGWKEAGESLRNAVKKTIAQKIVTYDLARQMEGAKEVKCSEYADAVIRNIVS